MRTNVVIDDEILAEALRISGLRTKKELIGVALQEFVRNHSRLDIRELKGKISFRADYDYKTTRIG